MRVTLKETRLVGDKDQKKLDKGQGQLFSPSASQFIGMMATAEFQWILRCYFRNNYTTMQCVSNRSNLLPAKVVASMKYL